MGTREPAPIARAAERASVRTPLSLALGAAFAGSLLAAGGANAQGLLTPDPLLFGSGGGFGLVPSNVTRQTFEAGIGARLTYSDNGRLAPRGREEGDVILEVSPFVRASSNTARLQGSITYSPRLIVRTLDNAADGLRHRLDALGNAFLVGQNLGVQARASVNDVNATPFGTASFDPSLSSNRGLYQLYEVAPYYRGTVGRSTYQLRYGLTYIDDGARNLDVTQQLASAQIGGPLSGRLGYQAYAEERITSYGTGLDFDASFVNLLARWTFSQELRVGVGANYSRSDLLRSSTGREDGWGPSADIDWRPTPRTVVAASWADTFAGTVARAQASHRTVRWVFGLDYLDSIRDTVSSGLIALNPNVLFGGSPFVPTTNPLVGQIDAMQGGVPGVGALPNAPLAFGGIGSALVRQQTLTASIGYLQPRSSHTLRAFVSEQDNRLRLAQNFPGAAVPQSLSQWGTDLRSTVQLDPLTTLGGTVRYVRSSADVTNAESALFGLQLDASYRFGRATTAQVGYRFTRQSAVSGAVAEYDENAVFAAVSTRF